MQDEPMEYAERYFFTPTAVETSSAIWAIRLGQTATKPNYHIGPRTTPYYSLHFVLEGAGTFIQDNQMYMLSQNDLFCLFPNKSHEYFTSKELLLKMAWIAFDGQKSLPILERLGIRPATPYVPNAIRPGIRVLLDRFFSLIRSRGEDVSDFAKISALYSVLEALTSREAKKEPKPADHAADWLQKGVQYMEMHYAEGITIEKIASFVGIDRAYFSRRFHSVYGTSPIAYLQQLKMKAATNMLERTDCTLTEIALSVGYPDLFSFSKSFKKKFDMSPSEYRSQFRSQRRDGQ